MVFKAGMPRIEKTPRKTFHRQRIAKELRLMCWRFGYGYLHLLISLANICSIQSYE